jgi:hypothetical protein
MNRNAWTYVDGDTILSYTSINEEEEREIGRLYEGIAVIVHGEEYITKNPMVTICSRGQHRYEVRLK